jgi:hypothetical protein
MKIAQNAIPDAERGHSAVFEPCILMILGPTGFGFPNSTDPISASGEYITQKAIQKLHLIIRPW